MATTAMAGCASGDKAGGSGRPVTLRIGTDDSAGRRSGAVIEEFARRVRTLSGGRIRVRAVFQAGGQPSAPSWDQRVARLVETGRIEMGVIPARAWDTEGVTTLRALHAPFLVTSEELVRKVVTDDVAADMLAGLDRAGVVGLALIPEDLRHPFAYAHPFLKLSDFAGTHLRAARSDVAYATLRELGATPEDLTTDTLRSAVTSGWVAGAESSFALASSTIGFAATATANVTFYPKVETLVIGHGAWERLSDAQRDVVRQAAGETLEALLREGLPEADLAQRYCLDGGRVVNASAADVAALTAAARPVYTALERDPVTKAMIARIRALKKGVPSADAVAACTPAPRRGVPSDPNILNGVWRFNPTYEDGIRAGLPSEIAADQMGVATIRMDGGRYDWRWRARTGDHDCPGTYEVVGMRVTFRDSGVCTATWQATFELSGRTLQWTKPRTGVGSDKWDQTLRELLHGKPWIRIQKVRSRTAAFPEGVYRANFPASFLVARGMDSSSAGTMSGLMTLTFKHGRWLHHTQGPARPPECSGNYAVQGNRVVLTADAIPGCDTAAGRMLLSARWSLRDQALRLTEARSDVDSDQFVRAFWMSKPWRKIG